MKRLSVLLLVVAVSAGCNSGKKKHHGGGRWGGMNVTKSVTVEPTSVRREDFVVWGDYPGEFVSDGMAELSSEVAGQVTRVDVHLGDAVKKGDTLAIVDPVTYRQQVRESQASVALSQASLEEQKVQLANLKADLARKKPLLAQKLVTEREIEDLEAQVHAAEQKIAIARATVDQNQARLSTARDSLSDTHVRAPFDGNIAERYVDVGAHVSPGQPLFSVVDDQEIYLRLRVPEVESGLVRKGMDVQIRVDALGGQKIEGTVGRVAPAVDPATRTLRVDVMATNKGDWRAVKPGMYARARLQLGSRPNALTLDNQAILKANDGSRYVWVVEKGHADKRTITTGLHGRDRTEITGGLKADDKVVLRGMEKLRPKCEVTFVSSTFDPAPKPAAKAGAGGPP